MVAFGPPRHVPHPRISPLLAARFTDLTRLGDSRYIAGPKLDGQRAQAHVRDGRTVASYAWPGRVLLRHPASSGSATWPGGCWTRRPM